MKTMYYSEKTAARVMNAMFNSNKNDTRLLIHHAWIDGKGRQCACDGHRAYRLNRPVAGVPDMDPANGIDLEKIFPSAAVFAEYSALELPTLDDVKTMIAEDNERQKGTAPKRREYIYTFGMDEQGRQLPAVNLKYLADMIAMYPDAVAYCKPGHIGTIYFKAQEGDGLICGMRAMTPEKAQQYQIRRRPAPKQDKPEKGLPVYGLRTFLALAAAANA